MLGPVTLRRGAGGGARVCAATAPGDVSANQIAAAAEAMRAWGQVPRWQVFARKADQAALDAALEAEGYCVDNPTLLMTAPVAGIAALDLALMSAFRVWPPLAVQREIWAKGGIGPARLAVIDRACAPKISLMGRVANIPAGTAFAAIHEGYIAVHMIEVLAPLRRRGLARNMLIAAARWALEHGAETLALLVTEANTGARALYTGMGFDSRPAYHYRLLQEETHDQRTRRPANRPQPAAD